MEIDQQSSSSSSTTASVPVAPALSQHPTNVDVSSSNIQHQNGFNNLVNGSSQRDSALNSEYVTNGNINTKSSPQK